MTRRRAITAFVIAWLLVFNYESIRFNFLGPSFPKVKFLFPPAGWIMFYRVDAYDGRAEVFGVKAGRFEEIDPHRIFATRWLGYDNIRRNVLISVLDPRRAPDFCAYLGRKFPEYQGFLVIEAVIPDVTQKPPKLLRRLAYKC